MFLSVLVSISIVGFIGKCSSAYGYAVTPDPVAETFKNQRIFKNGPCLHDQFWCSNGACVSKGQFCNGRDDCGDNSDEKYCNVFDCSSNPRLMQCEDDIRTTTSRYYTTPRYPWYYSTTRDPWYYSTTRDPWYYTSTSRYGNYRCIPRTWQCDGFHDCRYGADEMQCNNDEILTLKQLRYAKIAAWRWNLETRNEGRPGHKWGSEVTRKAISWYLGDRESFIQNKTFIDEMADKVSLSLLSRLALNTMDTVSTTELASFINALLVTCVDPRDFYVIDLVRELRERANAANEMHPSVMLALCNAGDEIVFADVNKTINAFRDAQRHFRTDVQALAIMALSCAANQRGGDIIDFSDIAELSKELKMKQYRNGTVENLKTTALVMQALYASETDSDEDNFDETKALKQILKAQKTDGSFGSTVNTYYVLPVLAYRSLVNISSSHCPPPTFDERESLFDFLKIGGQKSRIRFSLWIGNNRSLERTITLRVPINLSFYEIMLWAERIDSKYRFEYTMREKKPHVYSLSGIQDDPENNMFWFLYSNGSAEAKPTPIEQSPADVVPKDGQHLIYWYKCA